MRSARIVRKSDFGSEIRKHRIASSSKVEYGGWCIYQGTSQPEAQLIRSKGMD
jgi:hypothetical protein